MAALQQPKRPTSAYFLYGLAVRDAIQKELNTKEFGPVTKLQAERWKSLPEAEKAIYEKQALEAKSKYEKDLAAFKEAGGEVGKERKDKKEAKVAKAAKKEANADRPKKPAGGAFGIFINENRSAIHKSLPAGSSVTAVSKAASEKWKSMSEADKEPYEAKYQQAKAKYEEEMKAWKEATPTPESKKRSASPTEETPSAKKSKVAGRGRPKAKKTETADAPHEIDAEVLAKASKLNLEPQLKNLAARAEMKGISSDKLLKALESSNGLVNSAKAKLLGA